MKEIFQKRVVILFVSGLLLLFVSHSFFVYMKWVSIINEFKKKLSLFTKMDQNGRYEGDYYISIDSFENDDQHIHMILKKMFVFCYSVKFVFKKYGNLHSTPSTLNIYDSTPDIICRKLISDFKDFI